MKNRAYLHKSLLLSAGLALLATSVSLTASEKAESEKKLKIVFLMGQSNMVGYSHPLTAWYLTQPMYVPPPEVATAKSRYYNPDYFYWKGLDFASGNSAEFNARGKALKAERSASRAHWRKLVYGNFGRNPTRNDWLPEYGPAPKTGTKTMYPFLDKKAEEEGIYKRMVEHIESPENKRHPKEAIKDLSKRDELIADDIKRVRDVFLKGTKPEDFDRLNEALSAKKNSPKDRAAFAELVREHVNLPIAERTRITVLGEVSGKPTGFKKDHVTQGVLSVGYGKHTQASGPEYAFGISFERLVDGPVLIVKCAWGGTSVHVPWRPPSLANAETPIEKATREAKNKAGAEEAKKAKVAFTPKQPQTGTGKCWERAMAYVQKVLADPGKYHPDYDPKAGVELAGLVWFQGWNDLGNPAYGEQLVHFVKDFRKEVKEPELPVVCGLVGHSSWAPTTFDGNVNSGMLYASKHADLKGSVDIVNTVKYYPPELGLKTSVKAVFGEESDEYKKAEQIINRSCSNSGLHYFGSAKFLFLTGDAMARSMANLVAGGEPMIHREAEGC